MTRGERNAEARRDAERREGSILMPGPSRVPQGKPFEAQGKLKPGAT